MAEAVAERWVKHPRAKVWRALSDPKLAAAWLPFDGYRPEVGVQFVAKGPSGPASCEVVSVEAPERVVCSWEEAGEVSMVTIELTDDVGGTRVVVRHEAPDADRRKQLHGLWLLALQQGLDAVLVTGTATVAASGGTIGTGLAIGVGVGATAIGALIGAVVLSTGSGREGAAEPPPVEVAAVQGVPAPSEPDPERPTPSSTRPKPLDPLAFPPLPPMAPGEAVEVFDQLPNTLHPLYPQNEADVRSHRLVWQPLFHRSAITSEVRSDLVASDRMEGSALVVDLKPGQVFHDGHPISAEDVCFSVRTVLDPAHPTRLRFRERGDLTGCEVRGPLTAAIQLRAPLPDARIRAAVPVLPAHAFDPDPSSDVAVRPIGSGPYKAVRGRRSTQFTAVAPDAGMPDMVMRDGGDPLVQVRSIVRGAVHGIVEVPPELRAEIAATDDVALKTWTPNVLIYLAVNPSSVPDLALRQRLAAAIDRGALVQRAYGIDPDDVGIVPEPITGPFLMSSAFYNRAVRPQAVVRDGTPVKRPPLRLGFDPDANPVMMRLAEELSIQLRAAGFDCRLTKAEQSSPSAHDLWLGSWQVDPTQDPGPMVQQGDLGIRSAKVDAKLAAMRTASTDTEQQDAAYDLHRIVYEEAQWIGLIEDVRKSAWRNQIHNNTITPFSYWDEVTSWRVAGED